MQLCSDMATGVDSMGQYQWGDLVQLDQQNVGVIVRLERENFQVTYSVFNLTSWRSRPTGLRAA